MKSFKTLLIHIFLIFIFNLNAQTVERPKLVVGIVVDQMRFADLYRYYDFYSENGFKRLLKEGSNFLNTHYNYIPTNTGPGHASIYTGSTPYFHELLTMIFMIDTRKNLLIAFKMMMFRPLVLMEMKARNHQKIYLLRQSPMH